MSDFDFVPRDAEVAKALAAVEGYAKAADAELNANLNESTIAYHLQEAVAYLRAALANAERAAAPSSGREVTEAEVQAGAMQMARHFAEKLPLTRHDDAALAKMRDTFLGESHRILIAARRARSGGPVSGFEGEDGG